MVDTAADASSTTDPSNADPSTSAPSITASSTGSRRSTSTRLGRSAFDAPDGVLAGALATLAAATTVLLVHLGRGTTFFYDEWDWIQTRRTGFANALFRPHNGHLSAVPVVVFRVLFATVGLRHYLVFRLVAIAIQLLAVALFVLVVRRRLPALLVFVAAAALLLYGPGWQDLLWPFQIGYTAGLAGGLAAVLFLRRKDPLGDGLAALCLVIAVASSGVGLALLAGAAVLILVTRDWRRLWVIAVPVIVYGIWYLKYGVSEIRIANVPTLPAYMSSTAGATVGGLLGLQLDYGRFFLGVLATLLVVAAVRARRVPPMLAYAVASVIAVWAAYGLARGQLDDPTASRYLYPGAFLLVLAAAEAPRRRIHPLVALGLAVLLPFTLWSNSRVLRAGAASLRETSQVVRVELGALEIAGGHTAAGFRPDTTRMPQVSAGPYLAAVRALGSPAAGVAEIERSSESLREVADGVLAAAYHSVATSDALPSCASTSLSPMMVAPGSELALRASPNAAAQIWLRRFGDQFASTPVATVPPGQAFAIVLPTDGVSRAWQVSVRGTGVTGCAVGV
jgi:hypothetical protein